MIPTPQELAVLTLDCVEQISRRALACQECHGLRCSHAGEVLLSFFSNSFNHGALTMRDRIGEHVFASAARADLEPVSSALYELLRWIRLRATSEIPPTDEEDDHG